MFLYHVSEEDNIEVFLPRIPDRDDLDKTTGLVWAIDELRLPNFLTPRNCPRVTYHIGKTASAEDIEKCFSSKNLRHVVIIEQAWFEIMTNTRLFLYQFDESGFELQDDAAGYYVSKQTQTPVAKYEIDDLFAALFQRNAELRVVDNLWDIADKIKQSTLTWSLCRMGYAQPRK